MDNTPTFEFSDGKMYDENRTEFNRFLKKYPNSKSSEKIRELLKLLEAKTPSEKLFDKMITDRSDRIYLIENQLNKSIFTL